MVLESLKSDGQINIKNLVIESPKKPDSELPFDPERDISESDLRAMDEQAKAYIKDEVNPWGAIELCGNLKLLFPNRPLPVDFNSRKNFRLVIEEFDDDLALPAKILYSQKTISDFGENVRDYLDEVLQQETENVKKDLYDFSALSNLKLFYPEATGQLLVNKEAVKNSLHKQIEDYRNNKDWLRLAWTAAAARIVLEDGFDLKLTAEDWQEMHKGFEFSRETGFRQDFSSVAIYMMILAAEKVRVTPEEGLVLTMPQPKLDFRQHIPPLPQMRRF